MYFPLEIAQHCFGFYNVIIIFEDFLKTSKAFMLFDTIICSSAQFCTVKLCDTNLSNIK